MFISSQKSEDKHKISSVEFYTDKIIQTETEKNVRSNVTVYNVDDEGICGSGSYSYTIRCDHGEED